MQHCCMREPPRPPSSTTMMFWPGRSWWYLRSRANLLGWGQLIPPCRLLGCRRTDGLLGRPGSGPQKQRRQRQRLARSSGLPCGRYLELRCVEYTLPAGSPCAHQNSAQGLSGITTAEPQAIRYFSRPGGAGEAAARG